MSDAPPTILADLDRLAIKVEVRGDKLRLDAPAGVLTADLLARIKAQKPRLLAMLLPHPLARAVLATFPGAELIETRADATPRPDVQPDESYRASTPARQRVADMIRPIEQVDPAKARDLVDAWMERLAICEVDGGVSPAVAEDVACGELRNAIDAHAGSAEGSSLIPVGINSVAAYDERHGGPARATEESDQKGRAEPQRTGASGEAAPADRNARSERGPRAACVHYRRAGEGAGAAGGTGGEADPTDQ